MNKIRIYTDKGPHAVNIYGKIYHFKDVRINKHVFTICEANDDYITSQLLTLPGYFKDSPIQLKDDTFDTTPVLIGSFDKGVTIADRQYKFKKQSPYTFLVCNIPISDASVLINISPDNFWLANDPDKLLIAQNKKQEIDAFNTLKQQEKVRFTLKNYAIAEAENKRNMEKKDLRNVHEVMHDIYVSDAKSHGIDITEQSPLYKDDLVKSETKEKTKDKPIKKKNKIKEIIENSTKTVVNKSEGLLSAQKIVTPDDLPNLQKDLENQMEIIKENAKKNVADPSLFKYKEFLIYVKEAMLGIEDLNLLKERELNSDKPRDSIIKIIDSEIKKVKGIK